MHNHPDRSSPLKDDLGSQSLRSSSPAVKRPASDMGGQDREDHSKDIEMHDSNDELQSSLQKTISKGKRQKNDTHSSDPKSVAQTATSHESSGSDTMISSNNDSTSALSTAPTSIVDIMDSPNLPTIDEQVTAVMKLHAEIPKDGQKGYLISGKWLKRVLARASEPIPGLTIEKSALEEALGPVNNSDIAMVTEDSGKLKDEAGELFTSLRPGLQMPEDVMIFPEEAWNLIISWYGVAPESPIITRYAHALSEENSLEVQYEINPPIFSFLKVPGSHTPQNQKDADMPPPRMVASVHKPYMKWLKEAKELVHTDVNTKVRAWKILSGLKSASASGILTPAASRSASPAPGAEIIASAGSKMIIDVNTFALLNTGDQRELIDQKDQTMNENYNGKVDLRTLGLGRSDVIVIEEQTANADEYPSENQKFSIKGSAKAKNLTVSGRSSPTPSVMTRGRAQKEGRPKGIVGLSNLGNTCYMNSALQCIRSVDELTEYFRSHYWKKELNVDNPLGNHGEVAKAYAGFIDGVYGASGSYSPSPFKRVIGKYGPQFAGYGQQDSQEFLAFLLDGLSEDLNRIQKKPYIEKPDSTDDMVQSEQLLKEFADRNWNDYKARNDSVVIDLFAGMYKSTLTCPTCDKVSIVFDPFTTLTMQLPIENNWAKEINYFPLHSRPIRIDIDIDKNASIFNVKEFVSKRTNFDPNLMICAESYKNKVFKLFENTDVLSELNISSNDVICIYELSEKPTNYNSNKKKKYSTFSSFKSTDGDPKVDANSKDADQLLTTVIHRVSKPDRNNRTSTNFFAHPTFVVLSREDRRSYDSLCKKMLTHIHGMTTINYLDEQTDDDSAPEDSDTLVLSNDSNGSGSPSASATSVQDDEDLVDVSITETSQESSEKYAKYPQLVKLMKRRKLSPKLRQLFDIRLAPTDDGIPMGWNSINESSSYESAKDRAKLLPTRSKQTSAKVDQEAYDSGISDVATENESSKSQDSGSEDGQSPKPMASDTDGDLPELSDFVSGKDTRGATKHQKKKTYSRKGKKTHAVVTRKSPASVRSKTTTGEISELVMPGDAIILDWDSDCYDALFNGTIPDEDEFRGILTHAEPELFEDNELISKRASRLDRKKNGISLNDCLNEFEKTEVLSEQNAWFCPRCKEHRRAAKQFEIWKAPDILVMHLKRFASARDLRNKLDVKVDYPVEGLELSKMVRDQSDGKSLIYDLIAVDNHYGGLGGGHYTAIAKNAVTQNWYDYNDSHVSQVKDSSAVISKSAYLLFYRRRSEEHVLGGEKLENILHEVDVQDLTNTSRDTSPSGEGQRLGGFSHNGSSSASGLPRHVGDGGEGSRQVMKSQSLNLLEEDEDQQKMIHDHDVPPPPYNEAGTAAVPWEDKNSWDWRNLKGSEAPPSSENGASELLRRNSDASENASSTAGMGGSLAGGSDIEEVGHPFDGSANHLTTFSIADAADTQMENFSTQKVLEVPFPEDDEEELEVQELRIEEKNP